jgi:hypothetical protein
MEQAMKSERPSRVLSFFAFAGSAALLSSGCAGGNAPDAPPPCDQVCKDGVAMRSLREAMRFAYNLTLQGKPVGMQDQKGPCPPPGMGTFRIVGDGQVNAMLGLTTVDLTYTFTDCRLALPKSTTPERNYTMMLNGAVTEKGIVAMGGPTTTLVMSSTAFSFSGTVYDPPSDYHEMGCALDARQDGNTVSGAICGRLAGFTGF